MEKAPLREDIFEVLTDKATVKLLKSALIGFRPGGKYCGKAKDNEETVFNSPS